MVDIRLCRSDAVVLFDWLASVDLNTVPITHPAQRQALADLFGLWEHPPVSVHEPVAVELTDDERHLLSWGLIEWGGPARCTEEMAVAMGFASVADLFDEGYRIADDIRAGRPLPQVDWARALLATEIVFASDVVGSGGDWAITSGMDDLKSVSVLRAVQRKLPWTGVFGNVYGTRPDRQT